MVHALIFGNRSTFLYFTEYLITFAVTARQFFYYQGPGDPPSNAMVAADYTIEADGSASLPSSGSDRPATSDSGAKIYGRIGDGDPFVAYGNAPHSVSYYSLSPTYDDPHNFYAYTGTYDANGNPIASMVALDQFSVDPATSGTYVLNCPLKAHSSAGNTWGEGSSTASASCWVAFTQLYRTQGL